ncbi:hypothetical protein [Streptomyces sp. NPDC059893]|uniref:hypothetical protein n=1 Tax=Streptomyces sp. NPDC059893 TaxID=3346990 RepID=UPI003661CDA5
MALFEPFVTYFARNRELSREYAAITVRGSHAAIRLSTPEHDDRSGSGTPGHGSRPGST